MMKRQDYILVNMHAVIFIYKRKNEIMDDIAQSGDYWRVGNMIIPNTYSVEDEKFIQLLRQSKSLSVKDRITYIEKLENLIKQEDRKEKLKRIYGDNGSK